MEVLMIVVASACGAVFGFLWKYFLDKDLIEDAFFEWDQIYSEERNRRKENEKRLYAEVSRLHAENSLLKMNVVKIRPLTKDDTDKLMRELNKVKALEIRNGESEPWLDMLNDVNAPDWVDVDYGKGW